MLCKILGKKKSFRYEHKTSKRSDLKAKKKKHDNSK